MSISALRSIFSKAILWGLFPFFLPALFVPTAEAYPDLIRKGYQSCVSCHVSPSGGGVVTGYGRGVSEELAMFSIYEGFGQLAGVPALENLSDATGLFQAVKFDLQADYRSVTYQTLGAPPPFDKAETIQMERVAHAAFYIGKTTDLVASYGQYGNNLSPESRTHYLQIRTSKFLSLRWGRFLPAYGINFDDHTLLSRSRLGVSQGHEIFGLEAHYDDDNVTATMTRILGESVDIVESNKRLVFNSQQQSGFMARAGFKLGARHILGASLAYNPARYIVGGWIQTAPIRDYMYILADVNRLTNKGVGVRGKDESEIVGTVRIGSELFQGVTASLDTEFETSETGSRNRIGGSVQVIPIPHVEVRGQARRDSQTGYTTVMIMGHTWL